MRLDDDVTRHRTLTLFESPGGALQPDVSLDVAPGLTRRLGIDPRALHRLRRAVRKLQPQVVVAHGGEPLKYAVLAGIEPRRLVYYKIGAENERLTGFRRWLHRRYLQRVAAVATVSEDAAAEARILGVPPDRVRVIPNGRDPDLYPAPSAHDGLPVLIWIGHFIASKRPERFVEVVSELRARGMNAQGVMAGDGPLLEQLRSVAGDAGVELLGTVGDVPRLLGRGDAVVFTSERSAEGMPGVLIEAGMASLPVVTTEVPGAADVVASGETGFVVDVDDFEGLVDATCSLVVDADRRQHMGAAARQRCETRFSLDASARQWQVLLGELLTCTSST